MAGLLAVVVGCSPAATKTAGVTEGVISTDRTGKVRVAIAGQSFTLVTADGQAAPDAQIQIAGKTYAAQHGKLFLPDAALADLKRTGGFVALVPGYVPKRVALDGATEIPLVAQAPAGPTRALAATGDDAARTLRAPLQGLAATFASGTLAKAGTKVALATYQPAGTLPALGLQLTVDGALNAGKLAVAYDLEQMLQGWDGKPPAPWQADPAAWPADARQRATFAAQVQAAIAGLPEAQRAQLQATYGITVEGGVLRFDVTLGDNAQADGLARLEVDGLQQLGVYLEVTVLSSLGPALPGAPTEALAPGRELPPVVIEAPPPAILSDHGVGLLGDAGAAIIANNGGSLIGKVKGPVGLLADAGAGAIGAKRRLLAYTETSWAAATVVLERSDGSGYGASAQTDATGAYAIAGVPDTAPVAFVHVNPAGPTLFALARMPGVATPAVADVDAATTAVTCYVKDELARGKHLPEVSMPGYAADVATLTAGMTQAQADAIPGASVAANAAFVRAFFAGAGSVPQVLPPPPPPAFASVNTVPGAGGKFQLPYGLARAADGTCFVVDQGTNQVLKVAPGGAISTLAGSGVAGFQDGPGATAQFNQPQGLALDAGGNLYVADRLNHRVRKVAPDGTVSTLAGTGATGATDGPAASATFWYPFGVAVDAGGAVYVADRSNHLVRKIAGGQVTTLAGGFLYPEAVAVDGAGNVVVADRGHHQLKQVAPGGAVTVLAGTGAAGQLDGPAASALLDSPYNVMVDGAGNVFFTCRSPSAGMNTVGVLTPARVVATVAGTAAAASIDGPISAARLSQPWGLASDPSGRVYFTELGSGGLRVIIP
jgi:sugar lactone lactonase YvrE